MCGWKEGSCEGYNGRVEFEADEGKEVEVEDGNERLSGVGVVDGELSSDKEAASRFPDGHPEKMLG